MCGGASGSLSAEAIYAGMVAREEQMATATPEGVAFPHTLLEGVEETLVIACQVRAGVAFAAGAHPDSTMVFAMVGSKDRAFEHVRLLARLAQIALEDGVLERLRRAGDAAELYEMLLEEDRVHG